MADSKWGTKRLCAACATKFYDFKKSKIVCPKCDTVFDPEVLVKGKRKAAPVEEKPKEVKAKKKEIELEDIPPLEGEDIENTEDGEEEFIEDTSDLGAGEAEVEEVVAPEEEEVA
ncbi:MAG: TIGR02300 family protein [Dongiaceae bacterium]